MLTLDKRIKKWGRKINRNKTFTPIELEEMEDHLLVEIKQMIQYDGVTEEEAFQKALKTLGEQGILDEEFSKIRRSAFDKVKLWAYLQTIVILALVVFITVPYIHFPKKETTDPFVGERIGTIDSWMKDNKVSNFVTFNKEIYFYNYYLNNILCYKNTNPFPVFGEINFIGTYFNPKPDENDYSNFDVDSQNNLYVWKDKWIEDISQIDVYSNSLIKSNIKFPEILNESMVGFKIIDRKVIICLVTYESDNILKKLPPFYSYK